MTPDTFIQNFDLLAEAPGGVPKMRELILELAVSGRLVPQDSKDESAGAGIKDLALPDAVPYTIPKQWQWTTLRSVSQELGQKVPDDVFTYIDVSSIDKDRGRIGDGVQILRPEDAPSRARKIVEVGTVIYSTVRPYLLNIAVVDRTFDPAPIVSTAFFVMHPFTCVFSPYLFYYLRSRRFTAYVNAAMTGMAYPAINDGKMSVGPFPLPPLAEQKRIVARVDKLMNQCNELEARQKERNDRRTVLTASCLHAITSAPHKSTAVEIRRALDNFPLLTDTPESVAELRKTILQLAIQGRLVPHDPREEPASVLVKGLVTKRPDTIHGRVLRKPIVLPPLDLGEAPYELPTGWEWARFGHVAIIASNLVQPQDFSDSLHVAPNNIERDSGRLLDCVTVADDNVKSANHRFFPGQILYSKIRPNLNKVTIAPFEGLCSADMYPIDSLIWTEYLARYMLSATFLSMSVKEDTRVAMPKINQEQLNLVLVAVPPLAEQKRIAARVTALMAQCDALEVKLTKSRDDADTLAATIVHHVCNGCVRQKEATA